MSCTLAPKAFIFPYKDSDFKDKKTGLLAQPR